jgi:GxxExxY protein
MLIDAPFNHITHEIIGGGIEVHRVLGPGLLESTYMPCLQYELGARHLRFVAQWAVPIIYKGITLDSHYRVDLIVEDLVVVELKSVDRLLPVHEAQMLTYLKLTGCPAGLLMNFNVARLIDGVKRVIAPPEAGATGGGGTKVFPPCLRSSVPPFLRVKPLPPENSAGSVSRNELQTRSRATAATRPPSRSGRATA